MPLVGVACEESVPCVTETKMLDCSRRPKTKKAACVRPSVAVLLLRVHSILRKYRHVYFRKGVYHRFTSSMPAQ